MLTIGKPIGGGVPTAAYGLSAELGSRLDDFFSSEGVDVSGIGGTLAGNALAVASMRAALENALRDGGLRRRGAPRGDAGPPAWPM